MTALDNITNNLLEVFNGRHPDEILITGTMPISALLPASILSNDDLRNQILQNAVLPVLRKLHPILGRELCSLPKMR